MACTTGNISYPIIAPAFTATADQTTQYDNLRDIFPIEFNFGPRATAPIFSSSNTGVLDDSSLSSPATIRYNGRTYTLTKSQITQPYNKSYIIQQANKDANFGDLTLLFKISELVPNEEGVQKYLIISVPLLKNGSTDVSYLSGLAGITANGPFSLEQCLPAGRDFAVFTTCLDATTPLKALVMVFFKGCQVTPTTVDRIIANTTGIVDTPSKVFTNSLTVPPDFTLRTPATFSLTDFQKTVIVSSLTYKETTSMVTSRIDSPNAYKCVPFDPDIDINDSNIVIDTTTGYTKSMTDILAERQDVITRTSGPSAKSYEIMIILTAVFLGLLAFVFFCILCVYIYLWYNNQLATTISFLPPYILERSTTAGIGIIFGFAGLILGIFLPR